MEGRNGSWVTKLSSSCGAIGPVCSKGMNWGRGTNRGSILFCAIKDRSETSKSPSSIKVHLYALDARVALELASRKEKQVGKNWKHPCGFWNQAAISWQLVATTFILFLFLKKTAGNLRSHCRGCLSVAIKRSVVLIISYGLEYSQLWLEARRRVSSPLACQRRIGYMWQNT